MRLAWVRAKKGLAGSATQSASSMQPIARPASSVGVSAAQEPRLQRLAGHGVLDLALLVHPDDLLADELVRVELVLAVVLDDVVLDAGEEGGKRW